MYTVRVSGFDGGVDAFTVDVIDWARIIYCGDYKSVTVERTGSGAPFIKARSFGEGPNSFEVSVSDIPLVRDCFAAFHGRTLHVYVNDAGGGTPGGGGEPPGAIFDRLPARVDCIILSSDGPVSPRVERELTAAACRKAKTVDTELWAESGKVLLAHMEARPDLDGSWDPESDAGEIQTRICALRAYFMGRLRPLLLEHWEKKKQMHHGLSFPLQVAVFLHSIGEDWMPPMVVAEYANPRFDLVNRTIEVLNERGHQAG